MVSDDQSDVIVIFASPQVRCFGPSYPKTLSLYLVFCNLHIIFVGVDILYLLGLLFSAILESVI